MNMSVANYMIKAVFQHDIHLYVCYIRRDFTIIDKRSEHLIAVFGYPLQVCLEKLES